MAKLSAMVNTYNEAKNIEDCLRSLSWVDELAVVDSGSTDGTPELAAKYADKVISIKKGNFSEMRNAGLKHLSGDWVLIVDADERVTPELAREIQNVLALSPEEAYFKIPRRNYFLGKWIKHCGWYPDINVRLFRNLNGISFVKAVHERLNISGKCGHLNNLLIHYTYSSIEQFVDKSNLYSTLAAEAEFDAKKKVRFYHLLIRPLVHFNKLYILRRGYLDGRYGFILACLDSIRVFLRTAKLWVKFNIPGLGKN